MSAELWAAWIQAVGSILAIVAALIIAGRQNREHLAREAATAQAKISATLAILGACDACLSKADGKIRRGRSKDSKAVGFTTVNVEATEDDFEACIERLATIPIFDLPDEKLSALIVHTRMLMDTGLRRVAMVRDQLNASQQPDKNFGELLRQFRNCVAKAGYVVKPPLEAVGNP